MSAAATQDLRVSLIQASTIWHDGDANKAMYGKLARSVRGQSDLIVLPETFLSGFSNDAISSAQDMQGSNVAWLQALAVELGCVITGSMQMRDADQVYNRLIWARPDGTLAHYDKRHLFRMGDEHLRYGAGVEKIIVELNGWRICPLVCYDLRFPVFIRNHFAGRAAPGRDYDLLLFVANWPSPRAHAWRTLLRARAIENLSYCIGVNRVGTDGNNLHYSGDSVVLDFLGMPIVECGAQPQIVTATLSASMLSDYRARFPAYLDADEFALDLGAPMSAPAP
jgi:omega-amidase